MSGFKFTGLGLGTSYTDSASVANANNLHTSEFRMTLTTLTPVTVADVTAATTIYVTPYKGNRIALYDGTNWNMRFSAEMSIAVPNTASTMYDLFCYDNATVPTLEALAWTNDTTRATGLVVQDGVRVKSGALTRRYLGSFRTTGVSGQTEDSLAKRFVWNNYNRVHRPMRVVEGTAVWNYTTQTIRQANGSAANQLDFVMGIGEDVVSANILSTAQNTTNAGVVTYVGIGLDSTTTFTAGGLVQGAMSPAANIYYGMSAALKVFPGAGRHFLSWNEYSAAAGTTAWQGNIGAFLQQSGIHGELLG